MSREALITPQPMPVPGRKLVKEEIHKQFDSVLYTNVINDCIFKMEASEKKYKSPLMTHNGRSALLDAYQDLLDAINYLAQQYAEEDGIDERVEIGICVKQMNRIAGYIRLRLEEKGILEDE